MKLYKTMQTVVCALLLYEASLLFSPLKINAQSNIQLNPSQDTHVKLDYPSSNYGSEPNLVTSNYGTKQQRSFLKFDLSSLQSTSLQSATLYLTPTLERTVEKNVALVDPNSWTENQLTWENQPPTSEVIGQLNLTDTIIGQSIAIPLDTGTVQTFAGSTMSVAILNTVNQESTLEMYSKEGAAPPLLELETTTNTYSTDVNGDGITDYQDYLLVINDINTTNSATDIDQNNIVDIFDANQVVSNLTSNPAPPPISGIWLNQEEINQLPASGAAWDNLLSWASQETSTPDIADQDDNTDAAVVAKALVYAKTGQNSYANEVITALETVQDTPLPSSSTGILAVARNLAPYVVAADLVGYQTSEFESWLLTTRDTVFSGSGPSLSLVSCHEIRPNNFGTHCGTSRMLVDLYLMDDQDFQNAAQVFHGWLGNQSAYTGFNFGSDLTWQCDSQNPVGINPLGCTKQDHSIDGVLPDDQRRGGSFTWPPPQENYVWEALQGAVAQAWILHRQGYPAFEWENQALLRAVSWLHNQANFPAVGDDTGTPWIINAMYSQTFPTETSAPGKNGLGFYDWTHP